MAPTGIPHRGTSPPCHSGIPGKQHIVQTHPNLHPGTHRALLLLSSFQGYPPWDNPAPRNALAPDSSTGALCLLRFLPEALFPHPKKPEGSKERGRTTREKLVKKGEQEHFWKEINGNWIPAAVLVSEHGWALSGGLNSRGSETSLEICYRAENFCDV